MVSWILTSQLPMQESNRDELGLADSSSESMDGETLTVSSEENTDDSTDEEDMKKLLADWAIRKQIPHSALNELLKILTKKIPEFGLPIDPRTLLKTKPVVTTKVITGGTYFHAGIAHGVLSYLTMHPMLPEPVSLQINIDGLPLYKSSNAQFWPILGLVEVFDGLVQTNKSPFVIGIFFGQRKPTSLEFLHDFVEEAEGLEANGISFGEINVHVKISAIVCDAPARAFVRNAKGHNGYYGCDKCRQKGLYYLNRMTFPNMNAPQRSDHDTFDEFTDDCHYSGTTPLGRLSIGLVTQFPLDYMHLVCLGVTRKLVTLWQKGPLTTRLSPSVVLNTSTKLIELRPHIPSEFNRKPRSLKESDRWKATEFRTFLLYTGPVCLKEHLPRAMYENFMLLAVAMTILLSVSLCADYADYAKDLLVLFVDHCSCLYGKENVTYNMHGLIHLSHEAQTFGVLDNISCFPFENYLGQLKKMIRKPNKPLEQVIRRLSEREAMGAIQSEAKQEMQNEHTDGPVPTGLTVKKQFDKMQFNVFLVKRSTGNNCIQLRNKEIVLVENIVLEEHGDIFIVYKRFRSQTDLFSYPLLSSKLDIFLMSTLKNELLLTKSTNVLRKCVLLPCKEGFAGIPLLHM